MSYSIQCQKPLPVGASGSKQVTAKLLVPSGAPSQCRSGTRFRPPAPLAAWSELITDPSGIALLVKVMVRGFSASGSRITSGPSAMEILLGRGERLVSERGRPDRVAGAPRRDPVTPLFRLPLFTCRRHRPSSHAPDPV